MEVDDGKSREDLLRELRMLRAEVTARALSDHLEKVYHLDAQGKSKKRKELSSPQASDSASDYSLHWSSGIASIILHEMFQFVGLLDIEVFYCFFHGSVFHLI